MPYEATAASVTFIHGRPGEGGSRKMSGEEDDDIVLDPEKEIAETPEEVGPDTVTEEARDVVTE